MTISPLPSDPDRVSSKLNPAYLALSRFRRARYDECIEGCTSILAATPLDKAVWTLKTLALTAQAYIDDTDMEEEGIAEMLLDDNAISRTPRPGTSLRPPTSAANGSNSSATDAISASIRPMTGSGRPLSGFVRPGTQSRSKADGGAADAAFKGGRPGTSRPMSVAGRYVRLGTQSLLSNNSQFITPERIDCTRYSKPERLVEGSVLLDYLMVVEQNYRKALELAAVLTVTADYKDWSIKQRLAKCYYHLGLFRDAEKQYKSALAGATTSAASSSVAIVSTTPQTPQAENTVLLLLELCKVYLRLDQPQTVIQLLNSHLSLAPPRLQHDVSIPVALARVYESIGQENECMSLYRRVLQEDSSHVESIAMLGHHYFYSDQPEIAVRYYRRLIQQGLQCPEVWNNLALCCFYSCQYDVCLTCFDRALYLADDKTAADVWYNIGQVGVGIGDLNLAAQSFKVAISIDSKHAESFNNLGILELRKGNFDSAKSFFAMAQQLASHLFEPFFNGALVAYKVGECQESWLLAQKALEAYPEHQESKELMRQLKKLFTM